MKIPKDYAGKNTNDTMDVSYEPDQIRNEFAVLKYMAATELAMNNNQVVGEKTISI